MASAAEGCVRLAAPQTFILLSSLALVWCAPEIQLASGRAKGQDELSHVTQRPLYVYYGIPFAQPPVGSLRFRPPQPFVGDPNRIITSNTFRAACVQSGYTGFMDEDCLHLNVYVPDGGSGIKKVMVWIHGGAFVIGDAKTYVPSRLVTDYDVIVVTIQYRLAGNNGLRDEIMALQWVKDNIQQFGGDPDDVTIFGESAGAGSVSLLAISPLAKGLFTKGIMQSGTALSPFSNVKIPLELLYRLAKNVGCLPWIYFPGFQKSYHQRMVKCLQEKSAAEINATPSFYMVDGVQLDIGDLVDFGPGVDGQVIPKDPFTLVANKTYLEEVGALDRSYILGFTNSEGISTVDTLVFANGGTLEAALKPDVVATYSKSISQTVSPLPLTPEQINLVDFMYTFPRDSQGNIPVKALIDLTTDTNFLVPSVLFARALTKASDRTNVFVYLLDHYPQLKDPTSPIKGSNHGHDILYQMDLTPSLAADSMNNYIVLGTPTNSPLYPIFGGATAIFAKTGTPTSSLPGNALSLNWPRFDPDEEQYVAISENPEVRKHVYAHRVALWVDFLPKVGGLVFSGKRGRVGFS